MLRDKFNRTCTNYYTYFNSYTCVDTPCHVENSGCGNHSNSGCSTHANSGCGNHSNSGCSNYHNSGCNDHSDYGYDDHYESGCGNHTDSGCSDNSHYESVYSDGCPQYHPCNHTYAYSDHSDYGYGNYSESGCTNHEESGYSNHSNYGYSNHSDSGYSNHSNSGYNNHSNSGYNNHTDYTNYENGYSCSTYANYTNYVDATNAKLGGPISLTWNNSATKDTPITPAFVKEIRDNIRRLATEKQRNLVSTTNVESSSGDASDTILKKYKRVLPSSIGGIRGVLDSLYSELTSESAGTSIDEYVKKSGIDSLKSAISTLASKDLSGSYVNYVDANYDYNTQNTYANSSNIPKADITYTDTGILSYKNTYCSEYKNS